jgi:pimeloyl-ACP methyl ester carboxylesterase
MRLYLSAFCLFLCVVEGAAVQPAQDRMSRAGLRFSLEGRGANVVLIHAFHMDLREWDDAVASLGGRRHVLRYDVRGHGRSTVASSMPTQVEDLRSLVDELGIRRATFVGCSMGATIALEYALAHPDHVEGLILLSPGIPGIEVTASRDWMNPIVAAVKEKNPQRAAALWWESPIVAGLRSMPNAARYRAIIVDNAGVWTMPRPATTGSVPPGKRLGEVRVPVAVAAGELDGTGSIENARAVADGIPRATYVGVPGAGHMLSIERAGEIGRWILDR